MRVQLTVVVTASQIRLIDRLKARGKDISSTSSAAAMRRKLTVASLSGYTRFPFLLAMF